ncbi:MAG: DUF4163 domain-containing protein [Acidobacteria bacterium]|nr:DUF4163 domain-containing protein [Acidobacteriota bacterium]MDW7983822.1 hypothetical protein [Acidobacteriota bacterium]
MKVRGFLACWILGVLVPAGSGVTQERTNDCVLLLEEQARLIFGFDQMVDPDRWPIRPGGSLIEQVDRYVQPVEILREEPPRRDQPGYVKPGYYAEVRLPALREFGDSGQRQDFWGIVLRPAQESIEYLIEGWRHRELQPEDEATRRSLEEKGLLQDSPRDYLGIDYLVTYLNDRVISVLFCVDEYGTGAAHPNDYAYTINFIIKEGRKIELGDLFRPSHRWRDPARFTREWMQYCVNQIFQNYHYDDMVWAKRHIRESLLSDVHGRRMPAWKDFLLTRQGLAIVSSGFFRVEGQVKFCEIPYTQIRSALRPELCVVPGQRCK